MNNNEVKEIENRLSEMESILKRGNQSLERAAILMKEVISFVDFLWEIHQLSGVEAQALIQEKVKMIESSLNNLKIKL